MMYISKLTLMALDTSSSVRFLSALKVFNIFPIRYLSSDSGVCRYNRAQQYTNPQRADTENCGLNPDGSKSQRVDIHYKFIGYVEIDDALIAETKELAKRLSDRIRIVNRGIFWYNF